MAATTSAGTKGATGSIASFAVADGAGTGGSPPPALDIAETLSRPTIATQAALVTTHAPVLGFTTQPPHEDG